jgi:TonB family protein
MASLLAQGRAAPGPRNFTILFSSQAPGPAAMGFRRPVIILPESLLAASPPGDLTAALCHEMEHIRRHDYLLNVICEFIFLPVAFHPAAWLVKRRIEETRELACDEAAAGRLASASAYARSLVSLSRALFAVKTLSRPGYTLGVFDANILEERLMRLLEERPRLRARRAKLLLGVAALVLTLTALAACAFSFTAQENGKAQTLTAEASNTAVDFSGRWELDKTQSDLPSPSPDNLVQVIKQRGYELKITTTSQDWNTNKPIAVTLFAMMVPELSVTADNRESVQPYGPGQMRSRTRWEDNKLITEWTLKREGQVMVAGQWVRSLSEDGQTQTLAITAHDPNKNLKGQAKAVFVRTASETMPGGPAAGVVGGVKGGVAEGVKGGVSGGVAVGAPVQEEAKTEGFSGTVSDSTGAQVAITTVGPELRLEHRVDPIYPPLAKLAGIEGDVVLDATVERDGAVSNIKAERGHALLVKAALEAVRQWKYAASPQLPASTTVTLHFRLPRPDAGESVTGGIPAQEEAKTVGFSGTVSDPSGARVPNAIVSIYGESGYKRTTVTNEAGEFSFTGLPPGVYTWKVSRDGFEVPQRRLVVSEGSIKVQGNAEGIILDLKPGVIPPHMDITLEPSSARQSMVVTAKAPPEVVEKHQAAAPKRIRVGGEVEAAKVLTRVPPNYPESARAKGVEGIVLLEAVISTEGVPLSVRVLDSPDSALSEAALAAVRQWRYQPTLLNGQPIEVVTNISINFHLEK